MQQLVNIFNVELNNLRIVNLYRENLLNWLDFRAESVFNLLSGNKPFISQESLIEFLLTHFDQPNELDESLSYCSSKLMHRIDSDRDGRISLRDFNKFLF